MEGLRGRSGLATGNKFGTFGGVFTPSVLTILGVVMYLLLPRIVGEGGLYLSAGIILAAHLISVTTGLSVSSIATDKRVEAGGAYYIVSRSMGLAIGGTLGLALFVGLSFSISLYIIGFAESFLDFRGVDKTPATIRIYGTITLMILTFITLVSTSLAIRAQYLILVLIVGSLASILLGSAPMVPETPHLLPLPEGRPATALFGIFFPAVTGFTAGVNMSGDLRDPRRAIPFGTVAAIAVGMIVYLGLAAFMAFRIPASELVGSDTVLVDIAWSSNAVVAGIWGATLSSALGSILGAPRILQALSLDQITPRVFGIGHGRSNEPRYALVLAFLIGEMGILIGELDAIARIVSVFFITTYGFLNLSASFEMIASPDFRPDFKIPVWVPVLGATTCAILMVWLDLVAMLGAVTVMSGLFFVLKRRELQLETGDTLLGVWSSVVRMGLHRLTQEELHQRNWRPNILLFAHRQDASRQALLDFGHALTRHRGVATEFLLNGAAPSEQEQEQEEPQQGLFRRNVGSVGTNPYDTMGAVCRFHGFPGLEPNTVLLDWHEHAKHPAPFSSFLRLLVELDFNLLGVAYDPERIFGAKSRIDLWWSADAGSLPLNLALVRFITSAEDWRRAELRFFILSDDPRRTDSLHKATVRALEDARVEARVRVVDTNVQQRPHADWIAQHSAGADLTVIGLPNGGINPGVVEELDTLAKRIGSVLLVRASSQFGAGLESMAPPPMLRERTDDLEPGHARPQRLRLPEIHELAEPSRRFAKEHGALLRSFCEGCLVGMFTPYGALIEQLDELVAARYSELEHALTASERRRARILRRGPEALLIRMGERIEASLGGELIHSLAGVERGIDRLLEGLFDLEEALPHRVAVQRDPSDFAPSDDDPGWLRRHKARRRLVAVGLRRSVRYSVGARSLARYYLAFASLQLAHSALEDTANQTNVLAQDLGHFFNILKDSLAAIRHRAHLGTLDADFVGAEAARMHTHLSGLGEAGRETLERQVGEVMAAAGQQQQAFAEDLAHLHPGRLARRARRIPRGARFLPQDMEEIPQEWLDRQVLLLHRAQLTGSLALVQTRLSLAVQLACQALSEAIEGGVLAQGRRLREQLADSGAQGVEPAPVEVTFDQAEIVEDLHHALQTATVDVPEALSVLREASVAALSDDPFAEVEVAEVALRRQLQFLIDGELIGPIQEILAEVPLAEQRAASVADDVLRLISFTLTDVEGQPQAATEDPDAIVASGLERIDAELARLEALSGSLSARIRERLDHVLELTTSFAILGTAEAFEAHGHRRRSAGLSGLERLTERLSSGIKQGLVTLAYRRSAGILFARRITTAGAAAPVDTILDLVDAASPRPEVLEALPSYYVQLFSGQSALHSAFWVGRSAELQTIEQALQRYARGFHGAIVVTGDPGSGKTALCEVAIERFLSDRPVYRISPPPGGSCDLEVFRTTLQAELKVHGESPLEALPEGSVVLLNDVELWWERSVRGTVVLDHLLEQIELHSDRIVFFVDVGRSALRFLQRISSFGAGALALVECGPVDAEVLKEIVVLRHNATGLRYVVDGRSEDELSEWTIARLFTAHFDHSHGHISAALGSWLAHIEAVQDDTVSLSWPTHRPQGGLLGAPGGARAPDALSALPEPWVALLIQLVLHKEATVEQLLRISGLHRVQLQRDLAALQRTGLIQRRRDVVRLNEPLQHLIVHSLEDRRLLP